MSDFDPTPPPPPPPSFQAPLPPAAPKKKAGKVAGIIAVLVALGLIVAAIGTAVTGDEESNDSPATTQTTLQSSSPIVTAAPSNNGEAKTAVGEAVKIIGPSVVTITSDVSNGMGGNGQSAGTGIIITPEGEIVTNNHVVEGANTIMVRLAGQVDPVPATLLAADPSNDLALIKINGKDLPAATFADPNIRNHLGDESHTCN